MTTVSGHPESPSEDHLPEPFLENALDAISDAVFIADGEEKITFVNAAAVALIGGRREEIEGDSIRRRLCGIDPVRRKRFVDFLARARELGHPIRVIIETTIPSREHPERLLVLGGTISPLHGRTGATGDVFLLLHDITETRRHEEQLRKLSSAIRTASETVVITSITGVIEYVNPAFEQVTGYSWQEAVGQTPRILKSGRQTEEFYRQLWSTIQAGQPFHELFINRRKDGTLFYEDKSIAPVVNDAGTIEYYVAMGRDVTRSLQIEEKLGHREEELLRLNRQLESVVKARSRFIATVSHEIRTPLAVIKSGVDNMLDELAGPLAHDQRRVLDIVANNIRRLAGLIGNVLEFEKIESSAMTLELAPLDLVPHLSTAAADLRQLFDRRGIWLEVSLPDEPVMILGHGDRMTQVIVNLAGNALKYARGLVRLSLARHSDQARIEIVDDGAGIPPEKRDLIFEAFLQAGHHEQKEGTGLGLAIVRQIVIGHRGRVWAENRNESETGATGARFIVEIPLLETATAGRESEVDDGLSLSAG